MIDREGNEARRKYFIPTDGTCRKSLENNYLQSWNFWSSLSQCQQVKKTPDFWWSKLSHHSLCVLRSWRPAGWFKVVILTPHCHTDSLFSIDYLTMSCPDCVVIVRFQPTNFLVVQLIRASVRYLGPVGPILCNFYKYFVFNLCRNQFQNISLQWLCRILLDICQRL